MTMNGLSHRSPGLVLRSGRRIRCNFRIGGRRGAAILWEPSSSNSKIYRALQGQRDRQIDEDRGDDDGD